MLNACSDANALAWTPGEVGICLWTAKLPVGSFRGSGTGRKRARRDHFLYDFKGTPSARQAALRRPSSNAGVRAHRGIARNGVRTGPEPGGVTGSSPGRGGRPAAPSRAEALGARRRHHVSRPAPAGRQSPPQRSPMTAIARTGRRVGLASVARSPGERSPTSARNAAHCPGRPLHPQGHLKILSNRCAESIFGTHPCARSLYRPSGPDGEGQATGQARNARGEPLREDQADREASSWYVNRPQPVLIHCVRTCGP